MDAHFKFMIMFMFMCSIWLMIFCKFEPLRCDLLQPSSERCCGALLKSHTVLHATQAVPVMSPARFAALHSHADLQDKTIIVDTFSNLGENSHNKIKSCTDVLEDGRFGAFGFDSHISCCRPLSK